MKMASFFLLSFFVFFVSATVKERRLYFASSQGIHSITVAPKFTLPEYNNNKDVWNVKPDRNAGDVCVSGTKLVWSTTSACGSSGTAAETEGNDIWSTALAFTQSEQNNHVDELEYENGGGSTDDCMESAIACSDDGNHIYLSTNTAIEKVVTSQFPCCDGHSDDCSTDGDSGRSNTCASTTVANAQVGSVPRPFHNMEYGSTSDNEEWLFAVGDDKIYIISLGSSAAPVEVNLNHVVNSRKAFTGTLYVNDELYFSDLDHIRKITYSAGSGWGTTPQSVFGIADFGTSIRNHANTAYTSEDLNFQGLARDVENDCWILAVVTPVQNEKSAWDGFYMTDSLANPTQLRGLADTTNVPTTFVIAECPDDECVTNRIIDPNGNGSPQTGEDSASTIVLSFYLGCLVLALFL